MTKEDIIDSDADVLVRVEPEGYNNGVIHTVYNMTNGTDFCSKFSTKICHLNDITPCTQLKSMYHYQPNI